VKNQDTRPLRAHSLRLSQAKDNFKLTHHRKPDMIGKTIEKQIQLSGSLQ